MTNEQPINENETAKDMPQVPEKFIDAESGEIRLDALVKSYRALETKLSQSTSAPAKPETPEEYKAKVNPGLLEFDDELNAKLFEREFTAEQVQTIYDLAGEYLIPMFAKMRAEFEADRDLERLIDQFGGAENWQEVSRQLMNFGKKNLPQSVFENLASSYDGVIALYKMMGQESAQSSLATVSEPSLENDPQGLQSMMRDPKYWKERDPAFIAKVTRGFERLYGETKS